jgi:hypothetical protein
MPTRVSTEACDSFLHYELNAATDSEVAVLLGVEIRTSPVRADFVPPGGAGPGASTWAQPYEARPARAGHATRHH